MKPDKPDPVRSAAILKLSFLWKNMAQTPGFKFMYGGILRDLKVTDTQVDAYIREHQEELDQQLQNPSRS